MIQLKGVSTPPPDDTRHVKSLCYHDGISLEHQQGPGADDTYLFYCVDHDDTANRWMILRVAPDTVQRLERDKIALGDAIPGLCLDGFVCIADKHDLVVTQSLRVSLEDIPTDYLPGPGLYLGSIRKKKR